MALKQGRLCERVIAPAERTAGLDEAGRGCLAGPVVAAAVILPDDFNLPGLTDSKKLSEAKRNTLAIQIRSCAVAWSLGVIWPRRIEAVNILNATLEAMARAAFSLRVIPQLLLLDGNAKIAAEIMAAANKAAKPTPGQRAIVHGDVLVPAISAASILAKTWRDKLMTALARRWPGYGLEKHKGYGTREHLAALGKLGPCPMHRLTFRGVLDMGQAL